jgi:hypothetical protein
MPKLLLISGSLRGGSTNSATLRTTAALAPAGMATEIYDGMGRLPHFNPDDDPADGVGVDPEVAPSAPRSPPPTPSSSVPRSTRAPCPAPSRTCSTGRSAVDRPTACPSPG